MKHLGISEARAELPRLVESAETTVITRHGTPAAVLLDWDLYRAMRVELELLQDPELERILADHARVREGDVESFEELAQPAEAQ